MISKNFFILILLLGFLSGCAIQNKQVDVDNIPPQKIYNTYKKVESKPSDLHNLYVSYYLDSEINQVLNLMHLGLYAYQKEYYADAEQVFDKVLLNIESIYGEDKYSEDAKSLWHGEDSKRFIGEPYERALAYYYRGLLYLKNNDFENARASFKGGWLQDARSQNEQFQSDFNIFLILDALSSKLNGDENLFLSTLEEMRRHEKFTESISISHESIDKKTILNSEKEIETIDSNTPYDVIELNKNNPLKKGISRLEVIEIYKNQVSFYDRKKIKLKDGSIIYYNDTYGVTGWKDHGLIGVSKVIKDSKKLTSNSKYEIVTKSLSIRSKPSINSKKIGSYILGQHVTVNEETDEWLKTSKGWIFSKYAKLVNNEDIKSIKKDDNEAKNSATVKSSNSNNPSKGENQVGTLEKGLTKLDVIEMFKGQVSFYDREKIKLKDGSIIYYNSTNGVTGWEDHGLISPSEVNKEPKKFVTNKEITSKPTEEIKTYKSKIFEVKTKNLNIREQPNTTSKIVAKLNQHDLVKSVNETKSWIQTNQGWVFKKLLVKKELKENEFFYNGGIHKKFIYKNLVDGISNANLFLIIDTGSAPTKYTDGDYDSELRFSKGAYFSSPTVTIKDHKVKTQMIDDIHFQASTRGGREIDKIIDGKVAWKDEATHNAEEFKKTSKNSFKAATTILDTWNDARPSYNYGSGGNEADAIVGGVVLLFAAIAATAAVAGEISESAAEAVVTKADARHWQNIPGGIYLYMDKLTPGKYEINLDGTSNKKLKITIPEDGIVVKHVIDQKINKPSLLVSDYKIKNIIENEDQYLEKYTQQNN